MKTRNAIAVVIAALVTIGGVFITQVAAQGLFGTIGGTITDTSGAVIPGATVIVTNINTNVKITLRTSGDGNYTAPNLVPGTYAVYVSAKGFKSAVQNGITLQV